MKPAKPPIEVIDWGLIEYREAFDHQAKLVDQIIAGEAPEQIIFCTHPPVVTLGRGTRPGDVFAWKGETVEVNRGGRATYHGPSQIVMYPLIYIGDPSESFAPKKIKAKDLHQYLRCLEQSVIDVLGELGVTSQGRSLQVAVGDEIPEEATGVWVNEKKIASVGIAVRKWVTSHGVALNVMDDAAAFTGMNPCGFRTSQMTNIEAVIGKKMDRGLIQQIWSKAFISNLS